jgi:hypothetical protein
MIADMGTIEFTLPAQTRTHPRVKNALKMALLKLELDGPVFDGDSPPNIENVTNALWLWFARMDAPEAAEFLREAFRRALNRLESLMAEDVEDSPDQSSPPAPGEPLISPAEGPSRRKRKA